MKNQLIPAILSVAALAVTGNVYAQDSNTDFHTIGISIPNVAIVDIEPAASKNITLGFTAPVEAGLPIVANAANNSLWLNYSSIQTASIPARNVTVSISELIPGVDLNLTTAAATGSGDGTLGTPTAAPLTLTVAEQTIVSGIGSAYTGDGANNGHNLTYVLAPGSSTGTSNYAGLIASTTAVTTVTYTISDN